MAFVARAGGVKEQRIVGNEVWGHVRVVDATH